LGYRSLRTPVGASVIVIVEELNGLTVATRVRPNWDGQRV
jgi:hypothetical protein